MALSNSVDSVEAVFKTAESRTPEVLASVLETLKELREGGAEGSLVEAAKICADASREEDWRAPLGESGIVGYFQDILSGSFEDQQLGCQCLRLIGNSCADNDANRQRVIDHPDSLKSVIQSIKNPDCVTIATVVLYNICLDHEPSQLKAISDGACTLILEIISSKEFLEDGDFELDYLGRILEILLSHDAGKSSCPPSCLSTLIALASSPHCTFDDHLTLLTTLSALLSTQFFQTALITSNLVPKILDLLESSYTLTPASDSEKQDEKLTTYARNALVENIGDVSSQDIFLSTYPLSSPLIARVRSWLHEEDEKKVDLVVTACLVLGNVGRSDEVCGALAREYRVHVELFDIIWRTIKKYNDAVEEGRRKKEVPVEWEKEKEGAGKGAMAVGVLHAATGVLKNLAIAKGNKEVLGTDGALDVVGEMLKMNGVGVGQVWYSAVGLGRLVCVNCLDNVKFLLQTSSLTAKPLLSEFLRIYDAAEELPTKTEIARTVAAVLRTLNSSPTPSSKSAYPDLEAILYSHPVARPLWDMVLQDKWPVVRSEGLFALALMARGAAEEVWRECGEAEEKVLRGLEGKDLDNGVILVAEVKKRFGDEVEDRVEELLVALVDKKGKDKKEILEVRE